MPASPRSRHDVGSASDGPSWMRLWIASSRSLRPTKFLLLRWAHLGPLQPIGILRYPEPRQRQVSGRDTHIRRRMRRRMTVWLGDDGLVERTLKARNSADVRLSGSTLRKMNQDSKQSLAQPEGFEPQNCTFHRSGMQMGVRGVRRCTPRRVWGWGFAGERVSWQTKLPLVDEWAKIFCRVMAFADLE
jgi:hypothetical protein